MDFYTKSEIDEKFGVTISSPSWRDLYTKTEIETNVGTPETMVLPSNMLDFYTKTEIDSIPADPNTKRIKLTGQESWWIANWRNMNQYYYFTDAFSDFLANVPLSTNITVFCDNADYTYNGILNQYYISGMMQDLSLYANADYDPPTSYNGNISFVNETFGSSLAAFLAYLNENPITVAIRKN